MNNLMSNSYQERQNMINAYKGQQQLQNGFPTKKPGYGLPVQSQSESLLGMALYDFDNIVNDVGFYNNGLPMMPQQQQQQRPNNGVAPAFHPVDEYKDLTLKEILDLSDDFLAPGDDTQELYEPMPINNNHNNGNMRQMQQNMMMQHQYQMQMMQQRQMQMQMQMQNMNAMPAQFPLDDLADMMSPFQKTDDFETPADEIYTEENVVPQCAPSSTHNSKKRSFDDANAEDNFDDEECGESNDTSGDDSGNERRFRPYQAGQWAEKFEELCEYREKMGHCLVPHTYVENLALARWVKRQRYQYKLMVEGKSSTMTAERVKALEDIGFVWDSQGAAWGDRLYELKQFKDEFQHCNVPSNYCENPRLATWIKCQRRQYKLYMEGKASNMTPQRVHELEKLGFEWELRSYKKARTN